MAVTSLKSIAAIENKSDACGIFWGSLLFAAFALGILGCSSSGGGPSTDSAIEPPQIRELAVDCKQTAAVAGHAVLAAIEAETINLYDAVDVIETAFQAASVGAQSPPEKVETIRQRVGLLGKLKTRIESLYHNGKVGGEGEKYAFIKMRHQLARIDLVRACIEGGLPLPKVESPDAK